MASHDPQRQTYPLTDLDFSHFPAPLPRASPADSSEPASRA